jgi:hypothetical protein
VNSYFILNYIEKYIKLLKQFEDPSITEVTKKLEDALTSAKSNNKLWVSVKSVNYTTAPPTK